MPMKEPKNKPSIRNEISLYLTPRYILGLILIITSFASAYLISKASDKTFLVWAATVDLAPGEVLTDSDLTTVRVRLIDNAEQYLSVSNSIVGAAVLRPIGAAELIPSFSLASDIDTNLQIVPISIAREWVPSDLVSGSVVDVYGIPNRNAELLDGTKARSSLLLSAVAIDKMDSSARDLGGRIGVSLLVPEVEVAKIIAAINKNEFLLVRRSLIGN
ncbi:MAG: hypothetical protein RLZZ12_407 [Actinomycetota bacterium]|jgi:hypothetical protein